MPASARGTYLHGLSPEGDTEVRLASALSRFSGLRPVLPRPVGTHTHISPFRLAVPTGQDLR